MNIPSLSICINLNEEQFHRLLESLKVTRKDYDIANHRGVSAAPTYAGRILTVRKLLGLDMGHACATTEKQ